ncbi:MAG: DUF547 domain-containing protein [Sphingomonas sp.]|nr:DUF547 domain-containing protein [Sphingomonas sp.]
MDIARLPFALSRPMALGAGAALAAAAIITLQAIAQQSTTPMPTMPGAEANRPADDPFAIFATAHEPAEAPISYDVWNEFVGKLVLFDSGRTEIAYRTIKQNAATFLDEFVTAIQTLRPELLSKKEQLALWINLYNAQVVRVTTQRYPVRNVEALVNGPDWSAQSLGLSGIKLSLNDIRTHILARYFGDPRILAALLVPAQGGPAVQKQAASGPIIDAQLDAAAKQYINQSGVVVVKADIAYVSPVYTLNRMYFGGEDARLIAHLKQFAKPSLAAKLAGVTRVETGKFDWALNDVVPRQNDFSPPSSQSGGQSSGS